MANIFDELAATVSIHVFGALLTELERGKLTKAEIKTTIEDHYGLTLDPGPGLDALNTLADDVAAGTTTARQAEHVWILMEAGIYTRDEAKTSLGL